MQEYDVKEVRPLVWMVGLIIVVPLGFLLIVTAADQHSDEQQTPTPRQAPTAVSFANDVMPIFEAHCYQCHGLTRNYAARTSLRLTSYERVMQGGTLPVVEPGDPENSQLYVLLDTAKMPREGNRLSEHQVQVIRHWIEQGAPNN